MFDRIYEKNLIDKFIENRILTKDEISLFLDNYSLEGFQYIRDKAVSITRDNFGKNIYIRGLIEFTNYCQNNCYYCGIRCSNSNAKRYRLSSEEVIKSCSIGYDNGFRTFVLQGGEDSYFNDNNICELVSSIKNSFPDCAITLAIGERSYDSYYKLFSAGADRYLLRHETANELHYQKLHPKNMLLSNRKDCLFNLKKIGYQVGAGFMVGSPYQTSSDIAEDLLFLHELNPHMVGIGPFITHKDTPFNNFPNGSVELTLLLIAMIRIMLPQALIPATTALSTLDPEGRIKGILSGANVLMPNLSPEAACKKYELYDNKIYNNEESGFSIDSLKEKLSEIGYEIAISRGDSPLI